MEVDDLTNGEKVVLIALARHLVLLDDRLSDRELYDLLALGVELGKRDFEAALLATEDIHRDREQVLATTVAVTRPAARAKIASELDRIAKGDGLHPKEAEFLGVLNERWS